MSSNHQLPSQQQPHLQKFNQTSSTNPNLKSNSVNHPLIKSNTNPLINPLISSQMESTVTRLLVATKQLLESLTEWSLGKIDESVVSDIYVRLGNEFNTASLAFSKEGIDMSDLNSVPDDLRACLETALSEDASPTTLNQHLPQVRQIVVHLLQGLKSKQAKWRATKRQQELDQNSFNRPASASSSSSHPSDQTFHHQNRNGPWNSNPAKTRDNLRRVAVTSSSSPPPNNLISSTPTINALRNQSSRAISPNRGNLLSSHSDINSFNIKSTDNPSHLPQINHKLSSDHHSPSKSTSKSRLSPVNRAFRSVNEISDRIRAPWSSSSSSSHSHSSPLQKNQNEIHSPNTYDIPLPPVPQSPPKDPSIQAQVSSLEALRKADILQRRASKRFSTYTYNKITSTASPHKRTLDGPQNVSGLGINFATLPRSPTALSHLTQREDNDAAKESSQAGRELLKGSSSTKSNHNKEPSKPIVSKSKPILTNQDSSLSDKESVLTPNIDHSQFSLPASHPATPERSHPSTQVLSTPPNLNSINFLKTSPPPPEHPTIFLQLGRDVKKVTLDSSPTIASLRVMFMDRFQYNSGLDNFPEIYLRDPQSGIQYLLEDLSDVKDRVVLSLNIDALDQVKTHIDSGLSTLAREIKDLKSSITTLRRQSIPPSAVTIVNPLKPENNLPPPLGSTDIQFHHSAQQQAPKVDHSTDPVRPNSPESSHLKADQSKADSSLLNEQNSVTESGSEKKLKQLSGSFKGQFAQVQALRRELGILRQLYGTFTGETKNMLSTLRSQTELVKQVAVTKVSSTRTFIDSGKVKLESRSQDLVAKVESLQDTVEDLKQDVTNRKIKPKPSTMVTVSESIESVKSDLEELTNFIGTMKPSWKKAWEDELQNIVDEQQLLNYQEDLVKDLKEDLVAVSNLFGHVKDYLDAKKVSKVKPREFSSFNSMGSLISNNPKEGLETVLMQVKALEPNPQSRLKAIELAEKQREKSLQEVKNDDEFAKELIGFVEGKKLKMTGGTDEIERVRNIKSEQALKMMMKSSSKENEFESNHEIEGNQAIVDETDKSEIKDENTDHRDQEDEKGIKEEVKDEHEKADIEETDKPEGEKEDD
ncbi:hypothetical protein O181_023273 [Austropuccinia psidii MF-1]|uniref:Actin interacting protein 3 C-terminal domain-containing protein n=1 Tax=Austropuccinia psidii MF-1 TaxID=1389203 RepID=A0A9Q3CGR8_9BASI|nr:hypothetical protein [Austropuccinia psidii MF-1]